MPCSSWGIPAGELCAVRESDICGHCYAQKGACTWENARKAYQRRLDRYEGTSAFEWVEAMVRLLQDKPHFRWFDSGDLQSMEMLVRIAQVARETPWCRHWLPTRQFGLVRRYMQAQTVPENLTIRLSGLFVDQPGPERLGLPVSAVHTDKAIGVECKAKGQGGACRECRVCWDKEVASVSYPLH